MGGQHEQVETAEEADRKQRSNLDVHNVWPSKEFKQFLLEASKATGNLKPKGKKMTDTTYKLIKSEFIQGSEGSLKLVLWSSTSTYYLKRPAEHLTLALLEKTDEYTTRGEDVSTDTSDWNVIGSEYYPMEMQAKALMAIDYRLHCNEPGKPSPWAITGFIDALPNADGTPVREPYLLGKGPTEEKLIPMRAPQANVAAEHFVQLRKALADHMNLDQKLRQGGKCLDAACEWMQCNVRRGDTLGWSSSEPVSIPFCNLENLALTVAKAAVREDREQRQKSVAKLQTDIMEKVLQYGQECRDELLGAKEIATLAAITAMLSKLGE